MTPEAAPRTAAARALLHKMQHAKALWGYNDANRHIGMGHLADGILAIEAEAAAGTALDVEHEHLYRLMTDSENRPTTGFVMCECGDVQSIDYDDAADKIERDLAAASEPAGGGEHDELAHLRRPGGFVAEDMGTGWSQGPNTPPTESYGKGEG